MSRDRYLQTKNYFLGLALTHQMDSLLANLERVSVLADACLDEIDELKNTVYFPDSCVLAISPNSTVRNSATFVEVGCEGVVMASTVYKTVAMTSGDIFKLNQDIFNESLEQCSPFLDEFLKFNQSLAEQLIQFVIEAHFRNAS